MHYKFGRVHRTIPVTPAMKAGIAGHMWSSEETVGRCNRPNMHCLHSARPCCQHLGALFVIALTLISLPACKKCPGDVNVQITGPATIRVGEIVQLDATYAYSDAPFNPVQPGFRSVSWESSETHVLSVSLDGAVRGIAPGTATVTATPFVSCYGPIDRISGTLTITVVP